MSKQKNKKEAQKKTNNRKATHKNSKYDKEIRIDATFNELIDMAAKGYGAKKKNNKK